MLRLILFIFGIGLLLGLSVQQCLAQSSPSPWTLNDCLQQGLSHSPDVLRAELQLQGAQVAIAQQRRARDPKVGLSSQLGWQFGRNIDPTTNTFNNEGIFFNSANVQGTWTVFQGSRLDYALQHRQALLTTSQADADQARFQLRLDISNAYLNVLLAEELLNRLQQSHAMTLNHLERVNNDIAIGVRPQKDRVNMEAQSAVEQRDITDAIFRSEDAQRELKRLLGLSSDTPLIIAKPQGQEWETALSFAVEGWDRQVVQENYPALRSAQARLQAAEADALRIRAERLPRVDVFANIGTNFSSAAQRVNSFDQQLVDQQVWIEGEPTTLSLVQPVPNYSNNPYFQQAKENFGQAVGLRVSWSIWDGKANQYAQEQAAIQKLEADLNIRQQSDWLAFQLDRATQYLQAAQRSYQLAEQSVAAAQTAYSITEQAYHAGGASAYELLEAQQRLTNAQAQLIEARYDCLFAYKVVQAY